MISAFDYWSLYLAQENSAGCVSWRAGIEIGMMTFLCFSCGLEFRVLIDRPDYVLFRPQYASFLWKDGEQRPLRAETLLREIKEVAKADSFEKSLSDPSEFTKLPMPFVGRRPTRRFAIDQNGSFLFQGRSFFTTFLAHVRVSKTECTSEVWFGPDWTLHPLRRAVIYGTSGAGKSHAIAAFVITMIARGVRVICLSAANI